MVSLTGRLRLPAPPTETGSASLKDQLAAAQQPVNLQSSVCQASVGLIAQPTRNTFATSKLTPRPSFPSRTPSPRATTALQLLSSPLDLTSLENCLGRPEEYPDHRLRRPKEYHVAIIPSLNCHVHSYRSLNNDTEAGTSLPYDKPSRHLPVILRVDLLTEPVCNLQS
jgi:hypothetical protein